MHQVFRGQRVLTPEGLRACAVHVAHGRIERIADYNDVIPGAELIDAGQLILMPGLVDSHVHVNEPGRTEWEGFASATRAAAAGGVTTIADMPLNSIPATTTVRALQIKDAAALGQCTVETVFIGGVVPGNTSELEGLSNGVCAFKCFLTPSGVDEFRCVDEHALREALPVLARLGKPLMVHAEDPAMLQLSTGPSTRYTDYLASRPPEAEQSAIAMMIRLLEWCSTPVHIVHLSSAHSLGIIRAARARGLPLTVETCPHYLTFAAETIPDGATEFKCAPPVRSEAEREALWQALVSGDIDLIVSDHSPCPPLMKQTGGDFFSAWGGIASLQLGLPVVWTGARKRGIPLERLATWMCSAPAKLIGLGTSKGSLAVGYDADLVIWDPDKEWVVQETDLFHRHKVTPYLGHTLSGKVAATYVRGQRVFPFRHGAGEVS